jgi:hypothetical protein
LACFAFAPSAAQAFKTRRSSQNKSALVPCQLPYHTGDRLQPPILLLGKHS